ncbi:pyridoxamine 5'-phosphate oxidase [Danxiaibacter flavus]|uniref:Pyridoxine/pyridoxamine 5'-phosphate oxidase n=1 Tax=Danxiaibacter flavus TaxID=3049108 RepID=A0ABV3ZJS9_9BACT|nr:pyridoxamine 5'-phosphate oxidase [Chitinophagaceae bacterium DXS]
MNKKIADIRKDYKLQSLSKADLAPDAIDQFNKWWNEAVKCDIDEVNAMTLATCDKNLTPHARIVLLKDFDENGFVFFSNYNSHKAIEIAENHKAAILFFWKELERQVRIEGLIEKIAESESEEYFHSRPAGSRISAWASPQSSIIQSRDVLDKNTQKYLDEFGDNIPRPAHWGGYCLIPRCIEFWQGRSSRMHDRFLYTRVNSNDWRIERLAP